ncbi:MAG: hypothetical protein HKO59_14795 [Phycisphaerales bacterium]|nr:hypothetical protein [Phycisphaerales bacterium]
MKPLVIGIIVTVLFAGGIAGGYWFLTQPGTDEATATDEHGHDHDDNDAHAAVEGGEGVSLHGIRVEIPENATLCAEHRIPDVICPFCTPALIEDLGFCGGHGVAEALCTRCQPALIAAFKVENDWCAEHGLPESQCAACGSG